jgi:hypothetical protein
LGGREKGVHLRLDLKKLITYEISNKMNALLKEDITVSISGDIASAIQSHYGKDDYSLMVENFFKFILPVKKSVNVSSVSSQLRGCASLSGLVDKTDKEIKSMMYQEKYAI